MIDGNRVITSREDARQVIADEIERKNLIASAADRIPAAHKELVAMLPTDDVRTYIAGLPKSGSAGLSAEEKFHLARWDRALGITEENKTAAREAWKADPVSGAITIDSFAMLAAARGKGGR
jgi:hypothetical protein